jgi:hypothetical protein
MILSISRPHLSLRVNQHAYTIAAIIRLVSTLRPMTTRRQLAGF